MPLTALQERVAALVAALPESDGFVLAGGAGLAAHGVLDRSTRDLDYFAGPAEMAAVQRLAAAVERAGGAQGLLIDRERDTQTFVRFGISDGEDRSELDLAIDYRALPPVATRYGPALDLRELGANKVLAIFDRAEPRDFIDLAQLTERFSLGDLVSLAKAKDPGLDLEVLASFMARAGSLPRDDFELDDRSYRHLIASVDGWRQALHDVLEQQRDGPPNEQGLGLA